MGSECLVSQLVYHFGWAKARKSGISGALPNQCLVAVDTLSFDEDTFVSGGKLGAELHE